MNRHTDELTGELIDRAEMNSYSHPERRILRPWFRFDVTRYFPSRCRRVVRPCENEGEPIAARSRNFTPMPTTRRPDDLVVTPQDRGPPRA